MKIFSQLEVGDTFMFDIPCVNVSFTKSIIPIWRQGKPSPDTCGACGANTMDMFNARRDKRNRDKPDVVHICDNEPVRLMKVITLVDLHLTKWQADVFKEFAELLKLNGYPNPQLANLIATAIMIEYAIFCGMAEQNGVSVRDTVTGLNELFMVMAKEVKDDIH